jgi:hypothetical protein
MKGTVDGKGTLDADVLFKSEAAEAFTLTPTWVNPTPFMFYQTALSFDASPDITTVKYWNLTIDNGSIAQRVLNSSQDIKDVLTVGKLQISGGMTVYFEDETRRAEFLAGTSTAIVITCTGAQIGVTGQYNLLVITLPHAMYTAYAFSDVDGLLGAAVTFNGYYDTTATDSITVALQNNITSYTTQSAPTLSTVTPTGGTTTGGTPVELTGTNFITGAAVLFGTAPATDIQVYNSTTIFCLAPAHTAGAVGVTVTNSDGGTVTKPNGYTYA